MRSELEVMRLVDIYLDGNLNENEKQAFERRISTNEELREMVQDQRLLRGGMERLAVREIAVRAMRRYQWFKKLKHWGAGLGGIVLIAAGSFGFLQTRSTGGLEYDTTQQNIVLETEMSDLAPPRQRFLIQTDSSNVVETDGGLILYVPQGAFIDPKGQEVEGPVDLHVREALNPLTVIKSGWSSTSDGELLESGGMFEVTAFKDGVALQVHPERPLYFELPTQDYQEEMQLYRGEKDSNDLINWIDPQPLDNYLSTVDIKSLDFYPPGYIDSLKSWGKKTYKGYTDSLYYAFPAALSSTIITADEEVIENMIVEPTDPEPFYAEPTVNWGDATDGMMQDSLDDAGESTLEADEAMADDPYQILPAKIRAIWQDEFQNTLLATREFEHRMALIHYTCHGKVLDLYVNQLDQPLWKIDQQVARMDSLGQLPGTEAGSAFAELARLRHGQVDPDPKRARKLRDYYDRKQQVFERIAQETAKKFREENQKKLEEFQRTQFRHLSVESRQVLTMYQQEFTMNLKSAFRQLGYPESGASRPSPRRTPSRYAAELPRTGAYNVDRPVIRATANRKSMKFTDKKGKTAVIEYREFSFQLMDTASFDRVLVYLLPKQLSSYIRLNGSNNQFNYSLNAAIDYNLVVIGYKGKSRYFKGWYDVDGGTISLDRLNEIPANTLDLSIMEYAFERNKNHWSREVAYQELAQSENIRRRKLKAQRDLIDRLAPIIFKCYTGKSPSLLGYKRSITTKDTTVNIAQ